MGTEGKVQPFRAHDGFVLRRLKRAGAASPALVLSCSDDVPSSGSLVRLERAYALRDELDSAWATRPLALTDYDGRPALLVEDPGGEFLEDLVSRELPLRRRLELAIAVTGSLGRLHERRLIHRDIKPSTLLVETDGKRAWLSGFGFIVHAVGEAQPREPPEVVAGTLAYMAPEQTGRVNRAVDTRADLYSLGVTLYQLFSGGLPFSAEGPVEWVHCHLARPPQPLEERAPHLPLGLAAIVMKLLAKSPEDRYQTAAGVTADLRRCLAALERSGHIPTFSLASADVPDRLLEPQRLYGREAPVKALTSACDRLLATRRPTLLFVSGYAGIGKSAVIREFHRSRLPNEALFAEGKFELQRRGTPYAVLLEALGQLVRWVLAQSSSELARWRQALSDALPANRALLVKLLPELGLLVDDQPAPPEVSPQEARNRLHDAFSRLFRAFATREHPVVLFLDDLQWLDEATQELLEYVLCDGDLECLLLIGAFRDNEVGDQHPARKLERTVVAAGRDALELKIPALSPLQVAPLVAEMLHVSVETAQPLAALVAAKTAGNPFFIHQFMARLREEELLVFERAARAWTWNLAAIQAKGYTANVSELVLERFARLPALTREGLEHLACVGSRASAELLATLHGASVAQVHAILREAVESQLVLRLGDEYVFPHDRLEEAAYALLKDAERGHRHLQVARSLVALVPNYREGEALFAIVGHFNRAITLLASEAERLELARLNLTAGLRSKAAAAPAAALGYLTIALSLLPPTHWEEHYELSFGIALAAAECERLAGDRTVADERLLDLAHRARGAIDRAAVACARMDLQLNLGRYDRGLQICSEYLRSIEPRWPADPTEHDTALEYERLNRLLGERSFDELLDAPLVDNPTLRATMEVCAQMLAAAFFTDKNLYALTTLYMSNQSLELGHTEESSIAYANLCLVLGPHFADHGRGLSFGALGAQMLERRMQGRYHVRIGLLEANVIVPRSRHVRAAHAVNRRTLHSADFSGQRLDATYAFGCLLSSMIASGEPLREIEREADSAIEYARKNRLHHRVNYLRVFRAMSRTLQGLTPKFGCFDDEGFDERNMQLELLVSPDGPVGEFCFALRRLQARYFSGDFRAAAEAGARAAELSWTCSGFFEEAECQLYFALAEAACASDGDTAARARRLEVITGCHRELSAWAERCPENFADRAALVGAELARLEGREQDAERLYEAAIDHARRSQFVHNEALAQELFGRYYARRGLRTVAQSCLRGARSAYLRWGALGKVRQLDELDFGLDGARSPTQLTRSVEGALAELDLANVVRALQAVSREIALEKLTERLMEIALQQGAATRGVLVLATSQPRVKAMAALQGGEVATRDIDESIDAATLPESLIRYVLRTGERVVLNDPAEPSAFSEDPYLRAAPARSICGVPIVLSSKVLGVLYLENSLTTQAFPQSCLAVLGLLASQAGISLENARLYSELAQARTYMAHAERLSRTGSFSWKPKAGQHFWSDEVFRILGLTSGGTDPNYAAGPRALLEGLASEAVQLGQAPLERQLRLVDGSVKRLSIIAHQVGSASSPEYVGAIRDVTEVRRAEEALERTRAALADVTRVASLGELAAAIAHEVNQPLAAARLNAGACQRWLSSEPPNISQAQAAALRAEEDAERASEVIVRLRALFSRTAHSRASVDVNVATQEVIALTRNKLRRSGVKLTTELAADLPPIWADRVQLQQVIMNLLLNASEAVANNVDRERTVVVTTFSAGPLLVGIRVQDNGVGVSALDRDRIFDAFHTTKAQGMGMGLSISRTIAESHGGRLALTAADGPGATFLLTLPIAPTSSGED